MNKEVIFIGRDYYFRSGTRMGLMYLTNGTRYDLAMLETDVDKGYTVTVRPANAIELCQMDEVLAELKRQGKI